MEKSDWITYLENVAAQKEHVDGLVEDKKISPGELKALLAVFPTPYEILSFVEASEIIFKSRSTLLTQFVSIYTKFRIEPGNTKELGKRLKMGFDKLQQHNHQSDSPAHNQTLDNPWSDLLRKAKYTYDKIKILPHIAVPERMRSRQSLADRGFELGNAPHSTENCNNTSHLKNGYRGLKRNPVVRKGDKFFIGVYPEKRGYLILLENDSKNKICCLCPSDLRINNMVDEDCVKVPENDPPVHEDACGEVQLLALLMEDLSEITWLENAKSDPNYIITEEDLDLILDNITPAVEIFTTTLLVVD
jgi:hypothetical protein